MFYTGQSYVCVCGWGGAPDIPLLSVYRTQLTATVLTTWHQNVTDNKNTYSTFMVQRFSIIYRIRMPKCKSKICIVHIYTVCVRYVCMDACELSVLFYAMSAQSLLPPPLLSAAPIGHPGVHCSVAGRSWIRLWGGRDGSAVIFPASWYWICKNLESRASQHKLFFLQTSQCIAVFFFLLGGWSKVYSDRWAHWVTA